MGNVEYICEICGNPTKRKQTRVIEGVEMIVCPGCSHLGDKPKNSRSNRRSSSRKQSAPPVYYGSAPKKKYSQPRRKNKVGQRNYSQASQKKKKRIEDLELIPDYRERLRQLRQKLDMRVDEFANSVKIAESTYRNVEKEKLELTIQDAMKIEKEHDIVLTQEALDDNDVDLEQFTSKSGGYTLGDVFFKRKK